MIHALKEARARTAITRYREHIEPDGEDLHEDEAEPEAWNARRQHRNGGGGLIHEGTAPVSGIDADRKRDDAGDQQRKDRQEEGRLRPVQQGRSNRHVEKDRLAEIALQQLADIIDILHAKRLIETEPGAQLRYVLRRGIRPQHHGGRVSGCDAQNDEDNGDDEEHHHDHSGKSLENIPYHE
ncbi:hypothetical protein D3C72_851260 [compost metagenome]